MERLQWVLSGELFLGEIYNWRELCRGIAADKRWLDEEFKELEVFELIEQSEMYEVLEVSVSIGSLDSEVVSKEISRECEHS